MNTNTPRHTLATVVAAATLCLALPVHAVKYGVVPSTAPDARPIINPFTGKQTDVWKLVGNLGCSGFQITRQWVMQAGHCGIAPAATATFTNHLGTSPVLGSDCYGLPGYDFQLCRLQHPENLMALTRYPALSTMPQTALLSDLIQYGNLMGYGRGGGGDGLAFVDFDGLPFGYDPATAFTPNNTIPHTVGGDSGGAAYWFAPGAADPVMVGVLTSGDLLYGSPLYFDQTILDFIQKTIVDRGDGVPDSVPAAQYYAPPPSTGEPAVSLTRVPTVSLTPPGLTLGWTTPSMTPAVSSFKVTVGRPGILERSVTVSAGTGNKLAINNLAPGKYITCVRPVNSIGPSIAALTAFKMPNPDDSGTWFVSVFTPNCTKVDYRLPQGAVPSVTGRSQWTLLGNKAAFSWLAAPVVPSDLPVARYRITATGGTSSPNVVEVTSRSTSISASKGSTVCATVAAVSALGQAGPQSSQVCVVVK